MKKEIESKTKPSSMAIIGAIAAQGVIRIIHRIKKENNWLPKKAKPQPSARLLTKPTLCRLRKFSNATPLRDLIPLLAPIQLTFAYA